MVREIRVLAWCDVCHLEHEQTPAEHAYSIGIVAGETRPAIKVLELCETHDKIAAELIALLAGIGTTPELKAKPAAMGRPPAPGPRTNTGRLLRDCPVCDQTVPSNTLVSHIWQRHRTDPKPAALMRCPDCGLRGNNTQHVAAHRRAAHGHDALTEALAGVPGYVP